MLKKIALSLIILNLAACNEDDESADTAAPPTVNTPEVLIIGHRGASALAPEHTLAAYQQAIDDGADFIEPDLVATKDGYLVARHENEISATTNVSDLPQFSERKTTKVIDGVTLTGWFTEDFSLNELNQLKARERIPQIRPNNTHYNDIYTIPTLEKIIELVDNHYQKTGKIIGLYIETKHPTYFQQQNLALENPLLLNLAKHKYSREIAPIYLQSFEISNLKEIRKQMDQLNSIKHIKIIQLYGGKATQPADASAQKLTITYNDMATVTGLKEVAKYADGVGPSKTYILPNTSPAIATSFVKDAHAAGLKVHPYTLRPENEFLPDYLDCSSNPAERCEAGALKEYELFFKAGVDGIFTDDPGLGRQALLKYQATTK